MELRPARRGVGPESFDDVGRVILLLPQSFDEPFGLGSQRIGLAAHLVTRLQRRRVPEANRAIAGAGRQRRAVGAEGQGPGVGREQALAGRHVVDVQVMLLSREGMGDGEPDGGRAAKGGYRLATSALAEARRRRASCSPATAGSSEDR